MKHKKRVPIMIAALALVLTGCGGYGRSSVELPTESPNGADQMKRSPCACQELPYDREFVKRVPADA